MNTLPITPSSSAHIIPFPASGKHTGFAKASKDWLTRTLAESISHTTRTFCTAIYLHFNSKIYNDGHGLVAWPSWETLIAKFGLSEGSIREAIAQAERHGLLRVERGRHNGQRRSVNRYYAIEQPANSAGWQPVNSAGREGGQPANPEASGFAVDSVITESIGESIRGECIRGEYTQPAISDSVTRADSVNQTPERALRPEEAEEAKPAKKYNATPELMRLVARWRADATNGSGDL